MATTRLHSTSPLHARQQERHQQNLNYTAIWGLILAAVITAVVYGIYNNENATPDSSQLSPTQAVVSPVGEGSTSSMLGTAPASNELTPSTLEPGTPDTITTEGSSVPLQGVQ